MSINEKNMDKFPEDKEEGVMVLPLEEAGPDGIQDAVFGHIKAGGPNYRSLGW
jgi:hypothetical protein